jgi:hypothetical protein
MVFLAKVTPTPRQDSFGMKIIFNQTSKRRGRRG